jgi:hypothetical protein
MELSKFPATGCWAKQGLFLKRPEKLRGKERIALAVPIEVCNQARLVWNS